MAIVYRKSSKGIAEIETRSYRLMPRLRAALILVDGKRSVDELHAMIPAEPSITLQALLDHGFIELAAGAASAAVSATAAPASASPAAPAPAARTPTPQTRSFDAVRRVAVRQLTDLVGPMSEALAVKIEKTRNMDELQPLLRIAIDIIGNTKGRSAAQAYATAVLPD